MRVAAAAAGTEMSVSVSVVDVYGRGVAKRDKRRNIYMFARIFIW